MTFSTLATAVNLGGKHKSVEVEVKGGVCVVVDIFLLEYSKNVIKVVGVLFPLWNLFMRIHRNRKKGIVIFYFLFFVSFFFGKQV
jgi:hypothetical protein